jgi:hypothetical protein
MRAALLEGFGAARAEVTTAFRNRLEKKKGCGRISLAARAYIGSVTSAHQ